MPNYYAHLHFGQQVLSILKPALPLSSQEEQSAFQAGLLGPDPLLFYRPWLPNYPHTLGVTLHHQTVRPTAQRLLEAVRQGLPFAASYAAGFLCHFALDSRCHPYIIRQMQTRGLSHTGMEAELDRLLIGRAGLNPLRDTPLPRLSLPQSFYETVTAAAFPGVTPAQFSRAMALFRRGCRLQSRASGTCLSRLTNWAGEHFSPLAPIRGFLLSPASNPVYLPAVLALAGLLEGEIVPTAEQLSRFFAIADHGGTLGSWYDRTFQGQTEGGPQGWASEILSPT